jgi:hypothetical protein
VGEMAPACQCQDTIGDGNRSVRLSHVPPRATTVVHATKVARIRLSPTSPAPTSLPSLSSARVWQIGQRPVSGHSVKVITHHSTSK